MHVRGVRPAGAVAQVPPDRRGDEDGGAGLELHRGRRAVPGVLQSLPQEGQAGAHTPGVSPRVRQALFLRGVPPAGQEPALLPHRAGIRHGRAGLEQSGGDDPLQGMLQPIQGARIARRPQGFAPPYRRAQVLVQRVHSAGQEPALHSHSGGEEHGRPRLDPPCRPGALRRLPPALPQARLPRQKGQAPPHGARAEVQQRWVCQTRRRQGLHDGRQGYRCGGAGLGASGWVCAVR
mmetsp:Transcript_3511/g.7007  ORF Transcript_3511/g.7007 Transcript_3511/m.7007 type:complete len:235 (+) Transcript_3511:707-1411(+)